MGAANPSLVYDAEFEDVGEQRRGGDRRTTDRRAAKQQFDTLFAATLLNHISAQQHTPKFGYRPLRRLRPGIAFDLRA